MSSTRQKLNPQTVKRVKERSAYGWAIWCSNEMDFHRRNDSVHLFSSKEVAESHQRQWCAVNTCDEIVQVKIIVETRKT